MFAVCLAAVLVFGGFVMRRLDAFLEKNEANISGRAGTQAEAPAGVCPKSDAKAGNRPQNRLS